jgi:protein involved in polysaccharide export with SLBB domain
MEGYHGLIRAQQDALALQMQNAPAVYFRGAVQRPAIPWSDSLTLAQGLLDAGYTGNLSPRTIRVMRQGRTYTIDVRKLLRGTENPLLEPGDLVEVVR